MFLLVPAYPGCPGSKAVKRSLLLLLLSVLLWNNCSGTATGLFVSISQVIGCEDHLRNDLYCVEWGIKLYSSQPAKLLHCTHLTVFFSSTTCVSQYQKSKTSLDLNEARDYGVSGWQQHQLDHIQKICTSLQTDNHTNTSSFNFYRPDALRHPANSVKTLRATNCSRNEH